MPGFARGLPQTQAAVVYARRMHAGQRRADGTPFILHPLEVGSLLCHAGAPDHLIAAGVMHDLIEKAGVTAFELTGEFGPTVTRLVVAVSEDGKIVDYGRRKAALRRQVEGAGPEALTLFAADKLSKLRELRDEIILGDGLGATTVQIRPRPSRLAHYRMCLRLLQRRLPDSPLVDELGHEYACCSAGAGVPTPVLAR